MAERWQQIERLYHSALKLDGEARRAFLERACEGDGDLRREVESLLAYQRRAEDFIELPALEVTARAMAREQTDPAVGRVIGHYNVTSLLGAGGMGAVYLAEDARLSRKVAIKLLPAGFTADQQRVRRFRQEARAASALNHPNIITIHEVGEADGNHYIVTEYVEGETLRRRIEGARMGLEAAIDVAVQVAGALAAAHNAGIVHRDIKPENIMVRPDGLVKVLDFGLAKLAAGTEAPLRLKTETESGVVMGTVSYMSPEQARGLKVDERTDIFSFGVVLYEMISGRVPFEGETNADVIASILRKKPSPLSHYLTEAPAELERLISKCLEKDRAKRYQSGYELLNDLKDLKARRSNDTSAAKPHPSIAVLPFVNMSADPENDYFCDGLAEELINALTKIEALQVAARTSAFSLKDKELDAREIGKRLNVSTILEGSVRKASNRLRITAQLINAADGYHLWSERYDRQMADVFAVQDEITLAIVDVLKVRLLGEEKAALLGRHKDNLEAYNLYLKGRYFWNRRPATEEIEKGIEYFEQAIAEDPAYALAYAGLADSYGILGSWENGTLRPREAMPKAKAAAEKALELDEALAEAHASLAFARLHYDWDWTAAEMECKRGIELNPSYASTHHWYSHYLMAMGRGEESLAESRKSLELDPLDLVINAHLAWHYYFAGQYDEAIEQCHKTLELYPESFWPRYFFGMAYEQKGMYSEAFAEFQKAIMISGNVTFATAGLGHAYAGSGKEADARELLGGLIEQSNRRYVPAYDIALIHAGLGEKDQAFDWLERACADRSGWMPYIKLEPRLNDLRSDARFQVLVGRVGLAP
ncbi:MAG TPA: protein kinase [Blastocatellia bacterium]|nr:protein kinase [Blastocatellia bacterium]